MAKKDKKEEIPSWIKDLYKEDLDRVIFGQSPIYYKQLDDKSLDDTHPEFDILTSDVSLKSAPSYKMGIVGKGNVFDNPWESSIYGRIFDKLDDYAIIPNDVFTKYLGKTLRGIKKRIPDKDDKKKFQDIAEEVVNRVYEDLDYYVGLDSTMLVDDKEEKEEGGPVNTNRSYGSGKYVIDPQSEDSKMAVYDEIWDYLTDKKGIPQTQAIGILSNIAAESGGDTEALGAAGDFGIQQWLGPRKKELQRRYGKKPTLTQQLDYLVDEYQGRVPGLGWNYMNQGKFFDKDAQGNVYNYYMYSKADFDNATNYKDATVAWNQGYGRPLGSTLRNEKRFEFADVFANRYGVPENEPMRYEFGQRDSGTGDGGQQPVPETVASAAPSLASHPAMDSWWEKEGQDLLYKMLAQSGANKKAIEDIANNIKNDPQSEDSKMAVYDEIWDYLTDKKGIPQTQAIGILSNIAAESGGDTEALGAAGDFGIQQWLGPRKKELQRRYGKKPTLTQQLDYLVDEYQGRVPGLGWNYMNQGKFFDKDAQGNVYNYYMYSKADFDNATNYKDATVAWNQGYGRPLGSTLRNEKRFEFADVFANRYGVPENEPMRYEFGQRDSGTGDGGQQPVPETVASAAPSLASHPAMDSWWEKEGQDLLYKMLAQSGANKKAIEDIANNIKNDPQSEAQIAEAERMRKEQAKRQLVLNMIPGLMLNIKGMSGTQN